MVLFHLYILTLYITPAALIKDRRLRTDSDTSAEVEERPASHPSAERHREDRDERSIYDRVDRPERLDIKMDRPERLDNKMDRPDRLDNKMDRPERLDNKMDRPERLDNKMDRPERGDLRSRDDFYDRGERDV